MPILDKQLNRDYQREWARRKKLGVSTKGILNDIIPEKVPRILLTPDERRLRRNASGIKSRNKRKAKLDKLIGSDCIICNSTRSLVTHEIYGIPHNGNGRDLYVDAFERPQDFVRLCYSCHKGVHWVMKWFNMTWDEIISTIKSNKR
jgi:hypothetical protein